MDYENIKSHFDVKQVKGDSCMALCPCHSDKKASLSISYDRRGSKTLIHCHAGCSIRDILDSVGLRMSDLYEKQKGGYRDRTNIAAVYKYTDSEGKLLFEKVRFIPKSFAHRRYVNGLTVWGLDSGKYFETYPGSREYSKRARKNAPCMEFDGVKHVLYNLPGVIEAVVNKKPVYIAEGEKDADNLIKLGLTATTNSDGASKSSSHPKWRSEYNEFLKGADVVLIPDNDIPGKNHMANTAKSLDGVAGSIKIVELPVPEGEDVSYWLGQGHTADELLNLVENTMGCMGRAMGEGFSLINYNFSDVGNAERLIALYGDDIRYSPAHSRFYIWSGRCWLPDSKGWIYKLAKSTLRDLKSEAMAIDAKGDEKQAELREQVLKFALRSENDSRITAMVNQCKSQPEVMMGEADKGPYLLNLKNGTLNLQDGKLQRHRKCDYITKMVDIEYDENAECTRWKAFLDKIFKGDSKIIDFVQKCVGYSLTGSQEEQCFFMLCGSGANGKSTFLNAIKAILGDYADTLKGSSLMEKRFEECARGDLAKLTGKRFVVSSELNEGQVFDESLMKSLTGGDTIPVRFLYGEEFPLEVGFKIWIGTNEKPRIKGTNYGIWRRVRMIPFSYTFSEDEKDEKFYEKYLLPELPGILNWAVEGCLRWQCEGLKVPEKVTLAIDDYRNDMDIFQRFIDERCVVGDNCSAKYKDLYSAYCSWCKDAMEIGMSYVKFNKKIGEKGFVPCKSGSARYWKGIGILG